MLPKDYLTNTFVWECIPISHGKVQQYKNCNYFCTNLIKGNQFLSAHYSSEGCVHNYLATGSQKKGPRFRGTQIFAVKWNKDPPPWLTSNHHSGVVRGVLHWGASWLYRDSPRGCEVGVQPCLLSKLLLSKYQSFICVQLFTTPWTTACQTPLSMELSRLEYWSELPLSSPRDTPIPGMELQSLHCRQIPYCLSHLSTLSVAFLHFLKLSQPLFPRDLDYNGFLLHPSFCGDYASAFRSRSSAPLHTVGGLRSWYKMQFLKKKKTLKPLP